MATPTGSWKSALAFLSLALSALVWLNGLLDSLQRPSVALALDLRQLELAALNVEVMDSASGATWRLKERT